MSIDNVLYLVGKGFEVKHDPVLDDSTITAQHTDIEFKIGNVVLTVEVSAWFNDDGSSTIFFLLHHGNSEIVDDNDTFDHWVTGDEIKKYAKKCFADFKARIAMLELIF